MLPNPLVALPEHRLSVRCEDIMTVSGIREQGCCGRFGGARSSIRTSERCLKIRLDALDQCTRVEEGDGLIGVRGSLQHCHLHLHGSQRVESAPGSARDVLCELHPSATVGGVLEAMFGQELCNGGRGGGGGGGGGGGRR